MIYAQSVVRMLESPLHSSKVAATDKPSDLTKQQISQVMEHMEEQRACGCHIDEARYCALRDELRLRGILRIENRMGLTV